MDTSPSPAPGNQSAAQDRAGAHLKAIWLMCWAVVLFSLLDATAKYLVGPLKMPLMQVVWVRFFSHFLLSLVVFGPLILPRLVRSARPGQQVLRSLCLLGATAFNFAALIYLQLDQTVTIFFLTPLLVAGLAGPLLGEWVGWRRLMAILAGFLGVILVMRPGFGGIHWAVLFSFAATLSYALYNISTRYMSAHDPAEVTQVFSPVAGMVAIFPFALAVWQWPADLLTWVMLVSLGVTGGFGHWLLILAHRHAPAPVLAPFVYVGLIFMVILGYVMFGDIPTLWTLAGGAIVIGSGLYLLYRERHTG